MSYKRFCFGLSYAMLLLTIVGMNRLWNQYHPEHRESPWIVSHDAWVSNDVLVLPDWRTNGIDLSSFRGEIRKLRQGEWYYDPYRQMLNLKLTNWSQAYDMSTDMVYEVIQLDPKKQIK